MEIPPTLESSLIPLVMLLTCEKIPEYQICEEIYQEHRTIRNNSMYFIIQKGKQCSLASSRGKPPIELGSITK